MRAKFIYEKFEQNSDPVRDLKIGFDPNTLEGYLKMAGYENVKIEKPSWQPIITYFSKDNYDFKFEVDANYSKSGMRGFNGFKAWIYYKRKNEKFWRVFGYSPKSRILKSTQEDYLVKVLKLQLKQIQEFLK